MAFEFDAATARPDGDFDASTATPVKPAGAIRKLADVGLSFGQGAAGGTKALTDVFGAGNKASNALDSASKGIGALMSDDAKQEMANRQKLIQEAEASGSTLNEIGANLGGIAEAPARSIAQGAGSIIPTMAAAYLTRGRSLLPTVGIGAAQGAGAVKGSIYDAVQQKQIDAGMSPADAQAAASRAQEFAGPNAANIAAGGVLGAVAGRVGAEGAILGSGAGRGAIRRIGRAAGEEALTEGAQGGQERYSSNVAEQRQGFDTPTFQGVVGQAVNEGVIGGIVGGGVGAIAGGRPAEQAAPTVDAFDPQTAVPDAFENTPVGGPDIAGATTSDQDSVSPPTAPTPSQAMGLDPNAGPISAAAAMAVDGGATDTIQRQAAEQAAAEATKKVKPGEVDQTLTNPIGQGEQPTQDIQASPEGQPSAPIVESLTGTDPASLIAKPENGLQRAIRDRREARTLESDSSPTSSQPQENALAQTTEAVESPSERQTPDRSATNARAAGDGAGTGVQPAAGGPVVQAAAAEQPDGALTDGKPQSSLATVASDKPATDAGIPATAQGQQPAGSVDDAAHQAATSPKNDLPEPTTAQKEAGNYAKGHVKIHGLDVSIENPKGSTRSGKRPDGSQWSREMSDHYGYVKRTTGADGEQVDVYVGPKPESDKVFVVDQLDQKTGAFDEAKVMMGYDNRVQAINAYRSNFDKGWKVGNVTPMTVAEFKTWIKEGDTTKPLAKIASAAPAAPDVNAAAEQRLADAKQRPGDSTPDPRIGTIDLTNDETTAEFERLYQDDVKADIRRRLGLEPKDGETDAKQSPFRTFLRQFGIATQHASDITGERGLRANNRLPATFRRNGRQLDELANLAVERGFLTQSDIDSADDNGGTNKLVEMIRAELRGERQVSTEFADENSANHIERVQRMELEDMADALGLPYETDISTDKLASMVQRIQAAMERVKPNGLLKPDRIRRNAIAAAQRIEAKRDQFEREMQEFASATIAEQNAFLDVLFDADGMPIIARQLDMAIEAKWNDLNGQLEQENGQADTAENGTSQEARTPDNEAARQRAGDAQEGGAQAQRGDSGGAQEGLTAPTRADVLRQQAQLEAEAQRKQDGGDKPAPSKPVTGDQIDLLNPQAGIFDAPVESDSSAATKPAVKQGEVENFGEALPPARRNMAAKLDEALTDDDIATRPLSEIWPLAENDAIEDTFAAAVAHAARAEVPAKPRTAYKVKRWVEKVKGVRDLAAMIVSGRVSREKFIDVAKQKSLGDWLSKVLLLEQVPRDQWKRIGSVEERPDAITYEDGKQIPSPMVRLKVDDKTHYLQTDGTVAGNMDAIRALLQTAEPEQRMEFEIRQRRNGGTVFINKKGDPEYRSLMEFDTVAEARKAITDQYNELFSAWEAVKARDNITERDLRSAENRPRVGKDYRNGRDMTPEDFQSQFGFRGGEFGKWVRQGKGDKERQAILNSAYDALMDLADIAGIPPKAISLNGALGIAFGSRGAGWASAHFEPSNLVINLTKTRGAGALAHEWLHALDNYFARMRRGGEESKFTGSKAEYHSNNFITHRPEPLMVPKNVPGGRYLPPMTIGKLQAMHEARKDKTDAYNPENWQRDPKTPEGVRPVVEARFAALVDALNQSPMAKRARMLDGRKSGAGYWSSTLEMAARAFESYVIAKMHDHGYHNDFLVNVTKAENTAKDPARYPYLMAGEVKPIADAFDALFDTLETVEDDAGNVAIREPDAPYETDLFGQPLPQAAGSAAPAKPAGTRVRGDVQPEPAVQDTPAPPGEYFTNTIVGSEVSRELGASKVTTPEQAASATRYLYKSAVERFDGIVTDKDGKVLGVVGGFKGAISQASVYPATIVGEAVRIPGAANIWFSHNHPSGTSTLSRADLTLNETLADVFRGSGIEPKGLLAVTGDKFSYVGVNPRDPMINGRQIVKSVVRKKTPVIERELRDDKPGVAISSPAHAKQVAKTFYDKANEPGIILLNSQNQVAAWIPIPKAMMGPLRDTGQLGAIYRAVSQANAGAAIIVHGGELGARSIPAGSPQVTPAENIGAALNKVDVRVLDIIDAKTNQSAAERGEDLSKGPVFNTKDAEEQARAAGFTMRAYRGVSKANPFNDSGTTWMATDREVAEAYAEEVMGFDDPDVLTVMVNPDQLPRHDASRLTEAQREKMQSDGFGNPQAVGIYDRSDDHPLGGSKRNVTVIHAPREAVRVIDAGLPMFAQEAYTPNDGQQQSTADLTQAAQGNIDKLNSAITRFLGSTSGTARPFQARRLRDHAGLQGLGDAFGATIQGFRVDPTLRADVAREFDFFNGVYTSGTVYLNENSQRPHLAILGHELAHQLAKTNYVLYRQLVNAIEPFIDKAKYPAFAKTSVGREHANNPDKLREEFLGEVLSDGFMNRDFWRAVGKKNPSLLQRVVRMVGELLNKAMAKMGYTNRTEQYLTDFNRVMQVAGEVMGEYGLKPPTVNVGGGLSFGRGTNEPVATNDDVAGKSQGGRSAGDNTPGSVDFDKWFEGSKVTDDDGEPLRVFHGTNAEFSEFEMGRGGSVWDDAASRTGAFFSTDRHDADHFGGVAENRNGGNKRVLGAYIRLRNPLLINDRVVSEFESQWLDGLETSDPEEYDLQINTKQYQNSGGIGKGLELAILDAKARGKDGAIIELDGESKMFVAFNASDIRILNESSAPNSDGAVSFNTKITGQTARQHTPEQLRAMKNVGFQVETPTMKERAQALWKDAGKKMAQGIVDQFAPVKALDGTAYGLLRLAKGASGAFESFLHGGKLKLTDNVYDFDETQKGGVVEKLLMPLQGEHHDFMRWVAANRAERLAAEGKENLFSAQDIADLKTLATGQAAFDYKIQNGIRAGQATRNRAEMYRDALVTFNGFNKNILDMAEQSGLIDGASRNLWEHEFYVPFYRVADDSDGGVRGMNIKGGVLRQQAFKALKGGKNALNTDLLDNTMMNWAHLLDASAKNRAAKATIEAAERLGVAAGGNQSTLAQMGSSINNKNGVVWFMDGGMKRYSLVDDPYIMTALTSLEYAGMRNPVMNAMSTFKYALTIGVTASPYFKIRNLIRDSVQVIGTGNISYNPLKNIGEGWKLTDPKSDAYFRLLAGGGTIHFGTMLEGSEAKRIQSLVESGVDDATILNNPNKVKAFYRRYVEPSITAYNELGNRGEAINRASLYDQLRKQGVSHADASLQARDLMDFSMQGSFTTIRFLSQTVPFFNARLVGGWKLARAAKEDPKRMATVLGAVTLASLSLLAAYGDDDDWKKREEFDRNNFWWFKFGGVAFRIPKPFEIGAVATLAERGFELAFDNEMTGERFRKQVLTLLGDNLSMNPVPQLVKPVMEVYANKNSFTGRPIETMSMERLKSEFRFTDRTSMIARGASTAANAVTGLVGAEALSPVQIDHMLRGYFGWLGSFVVGAADVIARPATGQAEHPTPDYWKTATGSMISGLRDAPSRYVSQMYEQAREIEQAYGTWRSLLKEGNIEDAAEFAQDNREKLSKYHRIQAVKRAESSLNQRIRMIERSDLSSEAKRDQIRVLRDRKDQVARM